MKRRDVIQLSVFALAAISFPLLNSCNPPAGELVLSKPGFLSRLFDKKTIIDAGKAYLEKVVAEKDEDRLIQLLSGNNPIVNSKDEAVIHQYIDEKVKSDFEAGKIVMVKGWVLAVTEARQCALFSLVNG
jgi:hypothetical protein